MPTINVPVEFKGTARVSIPDNLTQEEHGAAEYMGKLVAYFRIMGQDRIDINKNRHKFREIADKYGISIERAMELMSKISFVDVKGQMAGSFL